MKEYKVPTWLKRTVDEFLVELHLSRLKKLEKLTQRGK